MNEELLIEDDVVVNQQGLLDTLKEYLNPNTWVKKLDLSKQKLFELAIYLAIGFTLGFLVKKYADFLVSAAIVIACFVALHYFGFLDIVVHMDKVQSVLGIKVPAFQSDLLAHIWDWIKMNVAIAVTLVVGFLIGLRVA